MLEIEVLGGFHVRVDGHDIPLAAWRRRKSAAMLKILALAPGYRMHREQMMDLLWPELDPAQAANNLYQVLHGARRAIGVSDILLLRDQIVQINPDIPIRVDAVAFEQAVAEARSNPQISSYQHAIQLYSGQLLPDDLYESWASVRRDALHDKYVALALQLAGIQIDAGKPSEAIATLRAVVDDDPLHEDAQRALILAYARAGKRQSALRQYEALREALFRALEVEPEPETQALVERVRRGEIASVTADPPDGGQQRYNLPTPVSSFVGRQEEIRHVSRLLESSRLLTLTGPGGTGKSRLALEVARVMLDAYPDGASLVQLASLTDPDLIPHEVIVALDVRDASGQAALDTLRLVLQPRRMLLVLDNCEHLIEDCARIVDEMLRSAPNLSVLVTSREPLRIDGEVTWRVSPLSLPVPGGDVDPAALQHYEAVQLFVDRASSVSPGFELTPYNAPDVAEICQRLDGIPLAIELAAARASMLTVGQIAGRLSDRFQLLGGGYRSSLSRQKTLRAALDWSFDLLTGPERTLLARLSVFAGGFTLEAVEAICAVEPLQPVDVIDVLARLVDRSLVVAGNGDGRTRYRLLESMRDYARERLSERDEDGLFQRRHATYYADFAIDTDRLLHGGRCRDGLKLLGEEHDNLRVALDWYINLSPPEDRDRGLELAGSLHWFWQLGGHFSEGRNWLDRMLAASPDVPSRGLAYARSGAAILATMIGDYTPARELLGSAIELWRALEQPDGLALALAWSGWVELFHLDVDTARAHHQEALHLFTLLEDDWGIGLASTGLGFDAAETDEYDAARVYFEQALARFITLGDDWGIVTVLQQLAHLAYRRGDFAAARHQVAHVLRLEQQAGDRWLELSSLGLLGEIARAEGDDETATETLDAAINIAREIGHDVSLAWALRDAGFVALFRDDLSNARTLFLEALQLFSERGYQLGVICVLVGMAGVAGKRGDHYDAARLLGAVEAALVSSSMALAPADRVESERIAAASLAALGRQDFDLAWAAGQQHAISQTLNMDASSM